MLQLIELIEEMLQLIELIEEMLQLIELIEEMLQLTEQIEEMLQLIELIEEMLNDQDGQTSGFMAYRKTLLTWLLSWRIFFIIIFFCILADVYLMKPQVIEPVNEIIKLERGEQHIESRSPEDKRVNLAPMFVS